jgi:acyl-CoA synthetase (AMP-forming)/AMP-acid ligase II
MTVADYLLENCKSQDKDFVVGTNEAISYKELCDKTNILAAYINNKFGSGKEIMLVSQNNLFFIISYLAIIKSGNIAILLETRISENDLKNILNRCSITAFFIQEKFKSKLTGNRNIFTESVLENLTEEKKEFLLDEDNEFKVNTKEDDLALIIFTSGSTGSKKGVMLTHKNIRVNTESIIEYLKLTENDRIEVVLPFFYCYGLSLLHTHLRVGGSIVLNSSIFLGSAIYEIPQYQCTGFAGVPATYQILINRTNFLERGFPSIRYFAQAGGKLADKFITMITDAFPQKSFFVMYGATEATARLSYLPPHLVKKRLGSIGKGIPGVTLEVLDENDNPIRPGVVGEITARGENIMRGYYKDPEATNKVLKNGRYYTSDLATVDEDGYIYVVGRSSNIIKSAGYRISPQEIEDIVLSVNGVLSCVVVGVPDDIMGEAVVAVVETKEPSEKLKRTIISTCNQVLPSYKVPKTVVYIRNFPLNSSGKLDRRKTKEMLMSKINDGRIGVDINKEVITL